MHRILKEDVYYVLSDLGETQFFMNYTPENGGYALYTENIANAKKFKCIEDALTMTDKYGNLKTMYGIGISCVYMTVD